MGATGNISLRQEVDPLGRGMGLENLIREAIKLIDCIGTGYPIQSRGRKVRTIFSLTMSVRFHHDSVFRELKEFSAQLAT